MTYRYQLFHPYMNFGIVDKVSNVLWSKFVGQGPKVDEFEKRFAKKFKVKYPVAVNSGTSALELAYELVGLKKGDAVITTPLTCTATNIPLLRRGLRLFFADIREDTLNIDIESAKKQIVNTDIKAIVNVNLGGIESDIGDWPISVPIITDSAQSLGFFNGDYVINSFQAIKHFTTGDGGMLVCPTKEEHHKAKLLRWFGIDREKKRAYDWQAYKEREMVYDIEYLGYKYQMTDIAAVMGIEGLKVYDEILNRRRKLFKTYQRLLEKIDGIKVIDGKRNVYWLMTILVENRDNFARKLREKKIETNLVHIRNDVYKVFEGKRLDLPIMNKIENKYISLPLHPFLKVEDVEYICDVIKKGW